MPYGISPSSTRTASKHGRMSSKMAVRNLPHVQNPLSYFLDRSGKCAKYRDRFRAATIAWYFFLFSLKRLSGSINASGCTYFESVAPGDGRSRACGYKARALVRHVRDGHFQARRRVRRCTGPLHSCVCGPRDAAPHRDPECRPDQARSVTAGAPAAIAVVGAKRQPPCASNNVLNDRPPLRAAPPADRPARDGNPAGFPLQDQTDAPSQCPGVVRPCPRHVRRGEANHRCMVHRSRVQALGLRRILLKRRAEWGMIANGRLRSDRRRGHAS